MCGSGTQQYDTAQAPSTGMQYIQSAVTFSNSTRREHSAQPLSAKLHHKRTAQPLNTHTQSKRSSQTPSTNAQLARPNPSLPDMNLTKPSYLPFYSLGRNCVCSSTAVPVSSKRGSSSVVSPTLYTLWPPGGNTTTGGGSIGPVVPLVYSMTI